MYESKDCKDTLRLENGIFGLGQKYRPCLQSSFHGRAIEHIREV